MHTDTICAVATAPGGALGIIRISGPRAISITDAVFQPVGEGEDLTVRAPNTLAHGMIKNAQGEIVDDVLVSIFHAPHSYTGEDCMEISCHGSSYILSEIVQLLIAQGCRVADRGEFTLRAFMNGKMDLSQAEAVADVIASTSEASHRVAMNQMRGGVSSELSALRSRLLHLTSLLELELDFSDHEDLEFADRKELHRLSDEVEAALTRLTKSFRLGNAIKNGVPVAIIGETNAGKSTLLNALLGEERAIVSAVHGTTRDVIEDTVCVQGIDFRFIDTAGIRSTTDEIERMGIARSYTKMEQASIVLWVIDAAAGLPTPEVLREILPRCEDRHLIVILNKCDLHQPDVPGILRQLPELKDKPMLLVSAKERRGLQELEDKLVSIMAVPKLRSNETIVTNLRHYEALMESLVAIRRVQEGLNNHLPGDLISQDLRECLYHLADIAGAVTSDEVLHSIFSRFCIGK